MPSKRERELRKDSLVQRVLEAVWLHERRSEERLQQEMRLSKAAADALFKDLRARGFLMGGREKLRVTPEGRAYALNAPRLSPHDTAWHVESLTLQEERTLARAVRQVVASVMARTQGEPMRRRILLEAVRDQPLMVYLSATRMVRDEAKNKKAPKKRRV